MYHNVFFWQSLWSSAAIVVVYNRISIEYPSRLMTVIPGFWSSAGILPKPMRTIFRLNSCSVKNHMCHSSSGYEAQK